MIVEIMSLGRKTEVKIQFLCQLKNQVFPALKGVEKAFSKNFLLSLLICFSNCSRGKIHFFVRMLLYKSLTFILDQRYSKKLLKVFYPHLPILLFADFNARFVGR